MQGKPGEVQGHLYVFRIIQSYPVQHLLHLFASLWLWYFSQTPPALSSGSSQQALPGHGLGLRQALRFPPGTTIDVSLLIRESIDWMERGTYHNGQDGRGDVGETPSLLFQRERGDERDRVGRVRRVRVASHGVEHLRRRNTSSQRDRNESGSKFKAGKYCARTFADSPARRSRDRR
jgi:hypothetical protein